MGRLTRVGAGVHVIRTNASDGDSRNARTRKVSPGATTAIGSITGHQCSFARVAKQSTPVTATRCAAPSPAFTTVAMTILIPAFGAVVLTSKSRCANSHSAMGRLRACSQSVKPVETAVAAVAAAVVASQNSCASIAAASQTGAPAS